MYRKGYTGLAYEIVINSNPCISYIMEENTMTMQALVMAHAAFGHNHFFKNNYLFREQTDASGILDYLSFAKSYVARCEEQHGIAAVERILDAAHALMDQGVNRYGRRARPRLAEEQARAEARQAHAQDSFSDLWRTLPPSPARQARRRSKPAGAVRAGALGLPEENLLYFLEKFSPRLKDWERELLRIVRNIAQYFLPQKPDQGDERGLRHLRPLQDHEPALRPGADRRRARCWSSWPATPRWCSSPTSTIRASPGINPYALGFEMMCDIERIATEPTEEDRA